MRRCSVILATILSLAPAMLCAQEELTSDQLRRMYDDALSQMKTAQDRRNELARENEKLRTRIAELEKELQLAQEQVSAISDGTFHARSQHSAFDTFLETHPSVRGQWLGFLQSNLILGPDTRVLLDTDWPFYAVR